MRLDPRNWRAARMALLAAAALGGCALPSYSVGESGGTEASSSSGSGGAGGSSSSAGGAGGKGGAGGAGACVTDGDCPKPVVRCMVAACSNGQCIDEPVTGDHVSV